MEKIFVPHELKTLQIDVENRIFLINGENFGEKCTGFTLTCTGVDEFQFRMELDAVVQYATYEGKNRISATEHPVMKSWYSDRAESDEDRFRNALNELIREKEAQVLNTGA